MISPEDFVRAWQSSEAVKEVTEKTGMRARAVFGRAFSYRKKGVPLKAMKRSPSPGRPPLDFSALADLCKEKTVEDH